MTAYGTMDEAIAGMKHSLDSKVISKRVADVAGIPFGMPVFGYVGNSGLGTARDKNIHTYKNDRGIITFDGDFSAGDVITITVNGTAVTDVTFATSHANTMNLIVAQIEADISGCDASLGDPTGTNRVLWIDIDGTEMTVAEAVVGGSEPTGTITYSSRMVFIGFTLFTQKGSAVQYDADGNIVEAADADYNYEEVANVMTNGDIWVVTAGAVNNNAQAYAIAASGANQGKVDDAVSGNAILTGATIIKTVAAAGIALVRINK